MTQYKLEGVLRNTLDYMVTRNVDQVKVFIAEAQRSEARQELLRAFEQYGSNIREPYRGLDTAPMRGGFIITLVRQGGVSPSEVQAATAAMAQAKRSAEARVAAAVQNQE